MKVCIDAGHGGEDPGAVGLSPFRLLEKDVNLAIALRLRDELIPRGHYGFMTREIDIYVPLHMRAKKANSIGADVFVSIHCNAAENDKVEGIETFYFAGSALGGDLAKNIALRLIGKFPKHKMRGVKSANFAVLRLTTMPAVLVECEFITNDKQLLFLSDPTTHQIIAETIAEAI